MLYTASDIVTDNSVKERMAERYPERKFSFCAAYPKAAILGWTSTSRYEQEDKLS